LEALKFVARTSFDSGSIHKNGPHSGPYELQTPPLGIRAVNRQQERIRRDEAMTS
jgi:hypothetical protein